MLFNLVITPKAHREIPMSLYVLLYNAKTPNSRPEHIEGSTWFSPNIFKSTGLDFYMTKIRIIFEYAIM